MLTKAPAKTKGPVGPLFSLCDGQGALHLSLAQMVTGEDQEPESADREARQHRVHHPHDQVTHGRTEGDGQRIGQLGHHVIDVMAAGAGGREDAGTGDGRAVITEHGARQHSGQHRQHQADVAGGGHVAGERQHDAEGTPAGTGGKGHGAGEDEYHSRQHFDRQIAIGHGGQVLAGLNVTHHGTYFNYDDLRVQPKPLKGSPDVWLGGIAPSELKRVGRLADGWLPSFVTPADAERGRIEIQRVAAEHEREIDPEHFGALIPYAHGPLPESVAKALMARRPDLDDINQLVPQGWSALQEFIKQFVEVGISKFVVLPIVEPKSTNEWCDHLAVAAEQLLPLEN